MTKASTVQSLTVPGRVPSISLGGATVTAFEKGVDAYDRLIMDAEVELKIEDGTTVKGVIRNTQVGALIDLIGQTGGQSIYTYGQPYSPRGLIQALGAGEVVDVTKLYTAVTVYVPPTPPVMLNQA